MINRGRILNNREEEGPGTAFVKTVPKGKKWILMGAYAERDVSSTFDFKIRDDANNNLHQITQIGAATANIWMPEDLPQLIDQLIFNSQKVLGEGYDVQYLFGTAQVSPILALWVWEI